MKRATWLVAGLFMALFFLVTSCGLKETSIPSLVGKWVDSQGQTTQFTTDGRVMINNGNAVTSGKYRVIDDTYIQMDFTGTGRFPGSIGPDDLKFSITGDSDIMNVTKNGQLEIWTKVTSLSSYIGKWVDSEGTITEFTSDGRIIITNGKVVTSGRYRVTDNAHIQTDYTGTGTFSGAIGPNDLAFTLTDDGNTMSLTRNNRTVIWQRVKE